MRYFEICFLLAHAHMRMMGRFAFVISEMSFVSIFSSMTGLRIFSRCADISSTYTSSLAISSGNSIATTPGLSDRAILKALCISDGIRAPLMIVVAYFVMGRIIPTTSMIWKSPCFDFLIGFCPVMTIRGSPES